MAQELYKTMRPQIQEARQAGASICFAGHSLGGALATLLCSLTMLQLQQPTQQVTCTSFGSPPVLAHKDGKDGTAILEVGHVSCRTLMPITLSIALSLCTLQLSLMLIILPTHPKEGRCTFIMHLQLSQMLIFCLYIFWDQLWLHPAGPRTSKCIAVLQLLGLSESSIRSFVLDTDPIPRAMLSVDPTFAFLKQWPGMASLLSIRDWFTGQTSSNQANAAKFMYNNVGEVYLITWSVDTGHKVCIWCQATVFVNNSP